MASLVRFLGASPLHHAIATLSKPARKHLARKNFTVPGLYFNPYSGNEQKTLQFQPRNCFAHQKTLFYGMTKKARVRTIRTRLFLAKNVREIFQSSLPCKQWCTRRYGVPDVFDCLNNVILNLQIIKDLTSKCKAREVYLP